MPRSQQTSVNATGRSLRADAQRNRDAIVAAATRVFAEHGAAASLEDVARKAKVGIGTLYRHFPTREDLLIATCDDNLKRLAEESVASEEGAPMPALRRFLERLVEHASMYRGLAASFGLVLQSGSPGCQATTEEGRRLLERARDAGEVRSEVDLDDLLSMTTAISIAGAQVPVDTRRTARLVGMLVDGLTATTNAKPRRR